MLCLPFYCRSSLRFSIAGPNANSLLRFVVFFLVFSLQLRYCSSTLDFAVRNPDGQQPKERNDMGMLVKHGPSNHKNCFNTLNNI